MKKKLKLFVWENVLTDYTSGIIFALATSVENARKVICESQKIDYKTGGVPNNPNYVSQVWQDIQTEPQVFSKPVGFCVWGGG